MAPVVLLFSLSFHSFFEGIAVGLLKDMATLANLIIGICIHQFVMSISLGTSLKKKNTPTRTSLLVQLGFAMTEATGVAVGLGLSSAPDIVGSLILSVAGGTFIYIACSEIIVEEFSKLENRPAKLALFCLGALFMILLWFTDK
jgi:zinc transporter 1/2/3